MTKRMHLDTHGLLLPRYAQDAQDEAWYAAIEQARAQYKALAAMVRVSSTTSHAAEDLSF